MGPSLDAALSFMVLLLPFLTKYKESSGCTAKSRSAARVAILAGTSTTGCLALKIESNREVERFPIDGDWKPSACQPWYRSIVDYGLMSGEFFCH